MLSKVKKMFTLYYSSKTHRYLSWYFRRTFFMSKVLKGKTPLETKVNNLLVEAKKSLDNNNTIEKVLYTKVFELSNLEISLKKLKNNVNSGVDGEIKGQISLERLIKLSKELETHRYKPKPNKRIAIPKSDGGVRYLGIASVIDKVVQGAILNLLTPLVEKDFSSLSYGFRPGLSCHDALYVIKFKWQAIKWVINIDIEKCFDKLHHKILIKELSKYCDQATVELIIKLINVGYVDIHNLNDRTVYSSIGIPQGSLISPILSNLYLNVLDKFVEFKLLPEWNRGEFRKYNPEYYDKHKLDEQDKAILNKYPELEESIKRIKHKRFLFEKGSRRDSKDTTFRRLHYCRYADDFIFGFIGTKDEAKIINTKIIEFLETNLKLSCNIHKSKINHSSESTKYLGVFIKWLPNNKITKIVDDVGVPKYKAISYNRAQLRLPTKDLFQKAVDRGYAVVRESRKNLVRSTSNRKLASLELKTLVNHYNSIIRGLLSYYSCINQRSDLWKVISIYRKSCALTIADKLKLGTASKVFAKYGKFLRIKNDIGIEVSRLEWPDTLKTNLNFKRGKSSINRPF